MSSVLYLLRPKMIPHPEQKTSLKVKIYADMLEIARSDESETEFVEFPPTEGNKKCVTQFTRRSRARMFRALAKIRNPGTLLFITLTYRDENYFRDNLSPSDFQSHLSKFFKRFEHKFRDCGIIWRKEYQDRKSGSHKGEFAPHAHLIVRNVPLSAENVEFIQSTWDTVSGASRLNESARIDVQEAHSRKQAYYYLSKYVAKVESSEDGKEDKLLAYLQENEGKVGRHWGIRGTWDMTTSAEFQIDIPTAIQLKRLIRRWLKSRGKGYFARHVANLRRDFGISILGLGDNEQSLLDSTILTMLGHAKTLATCA